MVKSTEDLLKLTPYPTELYETFPLTSLTACSVFLLHEWGLPTSYENIAVLNHRLFPTKFAMVGWSQFPDANRTNRSILQMRPKYRNLATSITEKGVFLNERGIEEAKAILTKLGSPKIGGFDAIKINSNLKAERGEARPRTIHAEDLIKRLKSSKLFKMFLVSEWSKAEAIDLIGFLGVYDHTPSKEKRRKLSEFKHAAQELKDKETLEFIKAVEESFSVYLSRKY